MCPEKGIELLISLEHMSFSSDICEVFNLEKSRLRGDPIALYKHLKGGCIEVGVSHFLQTASNRTRGNGLKWHQGSFRLDIRKNFVTEKGG